MQRRSYWGTFTLEVGNWNPVIIDFGKSVKIVDAQVKSKTVKEASQYYWIAPEVLKGISPPSVASDIFSLGFLLKKLYPKEEREQNPIFEACISQKPEYRPKTCHITKPKWQKPKINTLLSFFKQSESLNFRIGLVTYP